MKAQLAIGPEYSYILKDQETNGKGLNRTK